MEKDTLLVPWDFTEVAEYALLHAIKISKKLNNKITLLHVVKSIKKGDEAQVQLNKDAKKYSDEHKVEIDSAIIEGK